MNDNGGRLNGLTTLKKHHVVADSVVIQKPKQQMSDSTAASRAPAGRRWKMPLDASDDHFGSLVISEDRGNDAIMFSCTVEVTTFLSCSWCMFAQNIFN